MNISNQAKFIGAIVLQVLIILIIIIFKIAILSGGTDVMLRILPVDPRDPLRGDYATFRYEISSLSSYLFSYNQYSKDENSLPLVGQTVYVTLIISNNKAYAQHVSTQKPVGDVSFIKGVVESANSMDGQVSIRYGVEDYFVPEGQGRSLNFWNSSKEAYAKVSIDSEGNAVLKQLYIDGQPWP